MARLEVKKNMKIGIMGGTFNPIHYGHLVTAEEALSQFKLDRVIFIPTGQPPHKTTCKLASPEDRYMMAVMATASNSHFFVSRIETERKGKSYTIDTLKELKFTYGESATFYFITGADAILEILTWKNPEEIITMCKFIAATRPGYNLSRIEELKKAKDSISIMEIPALAISSTDIRERIKTSRPIKYLLPESVCNYLLKNDLY
ncbi:MAG: nicotinate-nucleotide adenylyltransferase [Actinobacteria bacterium]|nr:nicotinate-nucleotide adenylyltransferase [Actinomycetota bacterium]